MTVGSEHRPNKRISTTLQKQIKKNILKEQTEPQTYTLVVKKKLSAWITPARNHTTENVWQFTEKPQLQVRFWPFKPCNLKTMGAPDFSKNWTIVLNFHAKIINTLIPVCQQTTKKWYVKRSCSTNYIFTTQHDFQTCFDKKKCLPAIDDFNNLQAWYCTSSSKKSFDFLDERKKRSRNDKLAGQHESYNRVRHCFRRADDIVT